MTGDAPNRYLYEDALRQGSCGTPYLDWECTLESAFSIVYGHHMDDGSVFADFARFSDRAYAEEHRDIFVWTRADDRTHELRVVAADVADADDELVRVSFESDEEQTAFLGERISCSDLVLEEPDLSTSRVWAFATCSYQASNSRTVVYPGGKSRQCDHQLDLDACLRRARRSCRNPCGEWFRVGDCCAY